jgi:hypothetical protein
MKNKFVGNLDTCSVPGASQKLGSVCFWHVAKKIHVLDPMRSWQGEAKIREHHSSNCKKLLDGFAKCYSEFFDGMVIHKNEWKFQFHAGLNGKSSR